jgi:hypothetical protein
VPGSIEVREQRCGTVVLFLGTQSLSGSIDEAEDGAEKTTGRLLVGGRPGNMRGQTMSGSRAEDQRMGMSAQAPKM